MTDRTVRELIQEAVERRYDRRDLLRRATVLGLSAPAIATLLAACGDDDDDEPAQPGTTPVPDDDDDEEETPDPDDDDEDDEPDDTPVAETGGVINAITTLGDAGIGNPILSSHDYWTNWITFSKLFKYDDLGNILLDLAEDFEYSDDGLELTLHLQEATWHDGEPFTSADVIFTFDTIQDENTDTPFGSRLQVGGDWVGWSAPDDRTVELTMSEPFAPFLFALSQVVIIPRHLLEDSDDINTDPFNTSPIGTGPYRVVERVPDQYIRYERYDDYFLGMPAADGWTVFFMADTTAGAAALDAGEIDMMFTPPEMQPRYEDNPDFRVLNYVYYTPITLAFNHRHPALEDFDVRRAIAHGIDKEALNDTVTRGRGLLANNQYATTGPLDQFNDYDNVNYMEAYPFDQDMARELLDGAGWTEGADGIRERDGQRLSLTLLTYSGFDEYQNGQVIIQEMLGDIGIEVIPQVLEYNALQSLWYDPDGDPEERAMELHEWPHPFEQDPDVYNELHSSNHPPGDNYMWFEDAEADELIARGRETVELDDRITVYHELDRRRMETLPALPLYCAIDAWVVSTRVESRNMDHPLDDTPSFRWYQRAFPQDLYKP
jgi:peptide/nickel transport system substrate-binding protein